MWRSVTLAAVSAVILSAAAGQPSRAAQADPQQSDAQQSSEPLKCEYVVTPDPGAKPTRLCMTQSQWAAKKKADAADPNRIVCHYEEEPGTRFASRKICMSQAQWADRRLQDRQDVERIQLESSGIKGP
jgi:hypothetical protein